MHTWIFVLNVKPIAIFIWLVHTTERKVLGAHKEWENIFVYESQPKSKHQNTPTCVYVMCNFASISITACALHFTLGETMAWQNLIEKRVNCIFTHQQSSTFYQLYRHGASMHAASLYSIKNLWIFSDIQKKVMEILYKSAIEMESFIFTIFKSTKNSILVKPLFKRL